MATVNTPEENVGGGGGGGGGNNAQQRGLLLSTPPSAATTTSNQQRHHDTISTRGIMLTDSEAEAIMDAYQDEDITEMTWTRQIVEKWLQGVRKKAALSFFLCVYVCFSFLS